MFAQRSNPIIAIAFALASLWPAPAPAQTTDAVVAPLGGRLTVEMNEGRLVRLATPASSVFIANPALADVNGDGQLDAISFIYGPIPGILVSMNTTPRVGPHMMQTPLIRGEQVQFTITNAPPDTAANIVYSFGTPANSVGLHQFGGIVIDLGDPIFYLDKVNIDANGEGILNRNVPAKAPLRGLTTQALIRQGTQGQDSLKSNPVYARIRDY